MITACIRYLRIFAFFFSITFFYFFVVMEYSSTVLVFETFNLKKYSYSNLKVLGLGLKISRVHEYDFYHTYNRNFRRNLLKSSVKVNVDNKELKASVQSGNKHLNKQLQEKWFQFMKQMPATDFKV